MPAPEEPPGKTDYSPEQVTDVPAEAWLRLGAGTGLPDIASHALDLAVPRLADAAGVLINERLLAGGPGGAEGGDLVVRRIGTRFADGTRFPEAAFPAGEVVALSAASPYGRCAASGSPVMFTPLDDQTLDHARRDGRAFLARYNWFLTVPMIARGTVAGLMTLARTPARLAFAGDDVALAVRVAERAGACIVNACLLDRYQRTAQALQEALLPAEPALPAGIEVAGRCLPAGDLVGGDFYDVIPLASGQTGLIVGDVMGHGIAAAATMAQLRTTAHALAEMELAPAELLARLDRATSALKHPIYATCAYAVIDVRNQHATIALAGHLPPVLVEPGGSTHVPDIPSGMSLGLGTSALGEARIRMPAGAILALFTDGLVETRTRPYDQGIGMLRTVLARQRGPLHQTCDTTITELGRNLEDDITLVLARIPR